MATQSSLGLFCLLLFDYTTLWCADVFLGKGYRWMLYPDVVSRDAVSRMLWDISRSAVQVLLYLVLDGYGSLVDFGMVKSCCCHSEARLFPG